MAFAAPQIGKPAPDFSAKGLNGETVSLASLKGKVTVLEWTNPGCPFVQKHYETGHMELLQKLYTGKDVTWVRINSSAKGKEGFQSAAEAKAYNIAHHVAANSTLLDADGTIGHAYDAKVTPTLYIINKDGTLAYSGGVDDSKTPNPTDFGAAQPYFEQAMDAVLAGKKVEKAETKPVGCGVKY